ncbi:MAG: lipid-A-disaccharide synthase [Candidatus Omnitrophota bacterium]
MTQKHILIVCGEASGDLNAANLINALKQKDPYIRISGAGGRHMKKSGAEVFYDIENLSVIGLFDVLKKLPEFFRLKKIILQKIALEKPDAIILVDFSGFNLRLAKEINPSTTLRINGEQSRTINNKIPVIYYISPQVWASRQGRIKTIKEYISKMIVLFKFEEDFYSRHGIKADFIGHPLLDIVHPSMDKKQFLAESGIDESKQIIALLPGSRVSEIKNILPVMLKTAILINEKIPGIQFIIAKSANINIDIYNNLRRGYNLDLKIIEGKTYDCLNCADFCLVASGTATLETAIMQKPFVIIYKMSLLNYLLYRPQIKVPYIGMANIVASKMIVPEFIQFKAKPKAIAKQVLYFLTHPQELEKLKDNLAQTKKLLGGNNAASQAAKIILDFLT